MTIHQRYLSYLALTTAVTLAAIYIMKVTSAEGIGLIVLLGVTTVSGYLTLALLVSVLTKNPAKTFHRFLDIFDPFLWP